MKKKICLAILFSFVGLSVLISPSIAQNLDHSFYIDIKDIAPEAVATKGEYFSVFIMDRPNIKWNHREQINNIIYDCTNLYLGNELIGCLVKEKDSRSVLHPVLYKERSEIILVYGDPSQKVVVFSSDELNRIKETEKISNIINSLI